MGKAVKKFFQLLLYFFIGEEWGKAYVRKHCLDDVIVDRLIKSEKKRYLLKEYAKNHTLKGYQIASILQLPNEISLKQEVLKRNELDEKEQELLITSSKNNTLLFETYLCPDGYYLSERTFALKPEFLFLSSLIEKNNMMGFEIFKTYVANNNKKVLTPELLKIIIENDNQLSRHILIKARLNRDMEEFFVENSSNEMLRFYISNCQFYADSAQLLLVERDYDLAHLHFKSYGLRSKAQSLYYQLRKEELDETHAD